MTTSNRGVGKFTIQNLVAVLRAIPESDGTYADVARVAEDYDGDIRSQNIANWVQAGSADIRNGNNATATTFSATIGFRALLARSRLTADLAQPAEHPTSRHQWTRPLCQS